MQSIAIILVHYKTADLLSRAVQALRADLGGSKLDAELIVVDNGSTEADRLSLQDLGVRWIDAGGNRGYAGGLNLGVKNTDADLLFFMNCDVEVAPGCMDTLVRHLVDGAAAVGPRFYWDRNRSVLLPPTEQHDLLTELSRRLSRCSDSAIISARARWRRHARRHWLAQQSFCSSALSGALIGVHRGAWDAVGPFDEAFKLYYEETDWLQRLHRRQLKSYYVPQAEAVHLYNQSAAHEPAAAAWFAASAERYQKRYYGQLICSLLKLIPKNDSATKCGASRLAANLDEFNIAFASVVSPDCRWIEFSPLKSGFPAVGVQTTDAKNWKFPSDLWAHMTPGTYSLQTLNESDQELQHFVFDVGAALPSTTEVLYA
jgi:N-acetylglucosaminyl-diphospho-decaprenol L-rhamnosyltransferase